MKTVLKIGLISMLLLGLTACNPRGPDNGYNMSCYIGTTMDIGDVDPETGLVKIHYACSYQKNTFDEYFYVENDESLLNTIREHYVSTDTTTGVVLDEKGGRLLQLYRVHTLAGFIEDW